MAYQKEYWSKHYVLIAPLWNWNQQMQKLVESILSSNRTFMELKYARSKDGRNETLCSNRTFMELKSAKARLAQQRKSVLIAPLWNWNLLRLPFRTPCARSNRTFMELKWHLIVVRRLRTRSSNRTFMELKCVTSIHVSILALVLIAPLWNWNVFRR